jgi:hypothetical protein
MANLLIKRAVVAENSGTPISFTGGINGCVSPSRETVLSTSIDALTSEYGAPDVVWLDVEGYECRALAVLQKHLCQGRTGMSKFIRAADWNPMVDLHSKWRRLLGNTDINFIVAQTSITAISSARCRRFPRGIFTSLLPESSFLTKPERCLIPTNY